MTIIFRQRCWRTALTFVALGTAAEQAWAHHAMDGRLPSNVLEGLLSGLAHPVIGLDHFAFVVAMGLLAIRAKGRYWIPAAFVLATLTGTGVHLASINIAAAEFVIALSLVTAGGMLIWKRQAGGFGALALGSIAGLFHGYAYGESIVGAQSGPLAAYLLGFALIQYSIAATVIWMGGTRYGSEWFLSKSNQAAAATGSIIGLIGFAFIVVNL